MQDDLKLSVIKSFRFPKKLIRVMGYAAVELNTTESEFVRQATIDALIAFMEKRSAPS